MSDIKEKKVDGVSAHEALHQYLQEEYDNARSRAKEAYLVFIDAWERGCPTDECARAFQTWLEAQHEVVRTRSVLYGSRH